MNHFTASSVKKYFLFPVLAVVILLGTIGGCNDNNGGSGGDTATRDPIHGVVIGDHPEEGLRDLRNALPFYA